MCRKKTLGKNIEQLEMSLSLSRSAGLRNMSNGVVVMVRFKSVQFQFNACQGVPSAHYRGTISLVIWVVVLFENTFNLIWVVSQMAPQKK